MAEHRGLKSRRALPHPSHPVSVLFHMAVGSMSAERFASMDVWEEEPWIASDCLRFHSGSCRAALEFERRFTHLFKT